MEGTAVVVPQDGRDRGVVRSEAEASLAEGEGGGVDQELPGGEKFDLLSCGKNDQGRSALGGPKEGAFREGLGVTLQGSGAEGDLSLKEEESRAGGFGGRGRRGSEEDQSGEDERQKRNGDAGQEVEAQRFFHLL